MVVIRQKSTKIANSAVNFTMNANVVDWNMFLRLQPIFWKYVRMLKKEGFDREEAYDAVFDSMLYRCQRGKLVKCEHIYFDARRILLRKIGFWFSKKCLRRSKLKASFYHPIRCLNDPEFFEKLFVYDTSRDPRETVEVKEIKYIVFNRISTYQERRQAVWELLSKGDSCASISRKINLGESRVCQIKHEMLSDLKQTLEGKYGRGYSKFPSKR